MPAVPTEVKKKVAETFNHLFYISLDGLFLCLWAAVNFLVNVAITRFHPEGIDLVICYVLQGLYGFATLLPVTIYMYRDIRIMWIQANQRISKAVDE